MISLLQAQESGILLAFYAQDVAEVVLCPTLQPEPNPDTIVEGYMKLEKNWVPVIPLARVLGLPDREIGMFDALIISKDSYTWALRVGEVQGVTQCHWDDLKPVSGASEGNPGLAAHLQSDKGLTSVLILPQLLLECERLQMEEQLRLLEARKERASRRLGDRHSEESSGSAL